eukprot:scaffold1659_cov255-Pinguiococcus_pyrenoidosus.AAC.1
MFGNPFYKNDASRPLTTLSPVVTHCARLRRTMMKFAVCLAILAPAAAFVAPARRTTSVALRMSAKVNSSSTKRRIADFPRF